MPEQYELVIENDGTKLTAEAGADLLEVLHEGGYEVPSLCGGMGLCGKCRVRILEGAGSPTDSEEEFFSEEEIQRGMRLSCRIEVDSDMVLDLPSIQGSEE
ncbi:2Fe-2S iron-sulfur cluster binding domain-containing protein, partial [Candidatus Bipolaricaulota bacterium]|nr:2Fe-2S iron-sulfur cluster binding domain-containing protein [Candidatus Bipolaricaulota bacterium]